jgi:hypothetical protein
MLILQKKNKLTSIYLFCKWRTAHNFVHEVTLSGVDPMAQFSFSKKKLNRLNFEHNHQDGKTKTKKDLYV